MPVQATSSKRAKGECGVKGKQKTIGLVAVLGAVVASVILAAPGGAAKPADSVTCNPYPGTSTITWRAGTTRILYTSWNLSENTGNGIHVVNRNSPGSFTADTPNLSDWLSVVLERKDGTEITLLPAACSV